MLFLDLEARHLRRHVRSVHLGHLRAAENALNPWASTVCCSSPRARRPTAPVTERPLDRFAMVCSRSLGASRVRRCRRRGPPRRAQLHVDTVTPSPSAFPTHRSIDPGQRCALEPAFVAKPRTAVVAVPSRSDARPGASPHSVDLTPHLVAGPGSRFRPRCCARARGGRPEPAVPRPRRRGPIHRTKEAVPMKIPEALPSLRGRRRPGRRAHGAPRPSRGGRLHRFLPPRVGIEPETVVRWPTPWKMRCAAKASGPSISRAIRSRNGS